MSLLDYYGIGSVPGCNKNLQLPGAGHYRRLPLVKVPLNTPGKVGEGRQFEKC